MSDELMCPRCSETRLVEVVTTAQARVALCGVCAYSWDFTVQLCNCLALPIVHLHAAPLPPCPRCGKPAQQSKRQ